jgi:hypothetical protein
LAIDRFLELIGAFTTGQIETQHTATGAHKFWAEKTIWHDLPWKFIFSIMWVAVEMTALALLAYGCINVLRNLTPKKTTNKKDKHN